MSFNMGAGAVCAIGDEGSWGVSAADDMLVNFTSESLDASPTKTEEETLLASKAAAAYALQSIKVGGDLSLILKPENAGRILKWALGGPDTVVTDFGGVVGQNQHSMILAAANGSLPSKTVYINRKQAIKKYSGMKVSQIKISGKAGDYIRVSITLKGKDESTGAIVTTTLPTRKSYKFLGATILAGATNLEFTDFDLTIDNALDDGIQTSASGAYLTEPIHGTRKVKLDIGSPYEANAEAIREANLKTDTLISSIVLHIESPEIIAGASKFRADITLNNCVVLSEPVNVQGRGMLTTKISTEATAVGAAEPLEVVIYDDQASAY